MIVSGIGALLLTAALAVVAFRWLLDARHDTQRRQGDTDIDFDELNKAEREVQDLDVGVHPDDADDELMDWGPGAPR